VKAQLTSTSSEGECSFNVSGVEYTYQIDAGHMPYIERLARYAPFKALNFVKQRGKLIKRKGGKNEGENGNFQERESNYE